MTEKDVFKDLWPHPVEDANADGQITLGEKLLYTLKMIPWKILSILVLTLQWAAQDNIKEFWPLAVQFVREAATSMLTGEEKYAVVRDRLLAAAAEKGIELAKRDINRLIENALAAVEP